MEPAPGVCPCWPILGAPDRKGDVWIMYGVRTLKEVAGGRSGGPERRTHEDGLTFVELVFTIAVFSVAGLGLIGTMGYSVRQNAVNRETAIASLAARGMIEQLRGETFANILSEFNDYDKDDLAGHGTSPGASFEVTELGKFNTEGAAGVGTIEFPTDSKGELLEDLDMPELGLPRDLNGDGKIDKKPLEGNDYRVLPVRIRVSWVGAAGAREFELLAVLRP